LTFWGQQVTVEFLVHFRAHKGPAAQLSRPSVLSDPYEATIPSFCTAPLFFETGSYTYTESHPPYTLDPENGGSMYIRNVGSIAYIRTVLQSKNGIDINIQTLPKYNSKTYETKLYIYSNATNRHTYAYAS
jgi:hypothetical protein